MLTAADFPAADVLLSRGIRRVIYVVESCESASREEDDLHATFVAYRAAGIAVDIVDRKKNMIISSGFNVYPVAIESAIYEHKDVREVIVIGVPDPYRGQAAKAFVTLKEGAKPFNLDELRVFLADRLGRHEMPAALEIRSELPRSPAGKLLAKVLIDEEKAKG